MFTTRPELVGSTGMVASTHWLASGAGMAVLEAGGNAFDAAAAAGFVLQVVEPHLNGAGGEAPIIGYSARDREPFVICGQGPAPRAATIGAFADLGLDLIPGTGLLPACVPGAFAAWCELLSSYGSRPLAEVLDAAIGYAEGGFPLVPKAVATIETVAALFREHWPTSAALYLPGGQPPPPGGRFRNPDLAGVYRRLLAEAGAAGGDRRVQIEAARRAFYEGFVAEALISYVASTPVMDTSGRPHAGLLAPEDLASFRAAVEAPVTASYRGLTVCKTGPWGQGPVFCQQLALLAGFDLDDLDPMGDEFVHVVVECAKLAFADREAYYGDPDVVDVPLATLLSAPYNDHRRRLIGAEASGELRPGRIEGRSATLGAAPGADGPGWPGGGVGEPTVATTGEVVGDTCHLDVVDRWGNLVSATPSGGWLQSAPTIPGLGFSPTTRAQMFWLTEGLPNSLAGGKRPRTTLSPTLVLRDGLPHLAFGTPGGDSQDQWSLIFFLRHLHHRANLAEAIDAPAWHTTHFPSSFYPRSAAPRRVHVEERLGPTALRGLRRRGHEVIEEDGWSLGRLSAVGIRGDGLMTAAANPRGMQGYAVGR